MLLEEFEMPPHDQMQGHGHAALHLCFVRHGGFTERHGDSWEECHRGSLRVSPSHVLHDLQAHEHGAQVEIVQLSDRTTAALARPLQHSVYFHVASPPWNREALAAACTTLDPFQLECVSLELAALAVSGRPFSHPPEWLLELRRELDETCLNAPSLGLSARRHGRHRSHVARSFRSWFGRSLGEHVRARRLAEAARLLRTTPVSIAALAHDAGFTDQAHFTHAFRARYGCPPAHFRRTFRDDATSVQDRNSSHLQDP